MCVARHRDRGRHRQHPAQRDRRARPRPAARRLRAAEQREPMDFGLSEEQELLQTTVRQFLANECPPTRCARSSRATEDRSLALWRGLAELGVAGLAVPGGVRRRGPRAPRPRARRRGARARRRARALPRPRARGARDRARRQRRAAARWLPALAAGERLGDASRSPRPAAVWQPEEWTRDGGRHALRRRRAACPRRRRPTSSWSARRGRRPRARRARRAGGVEIEPMAGRRPDAPRRPASIFEGAARRSAAAAAPTPRAACATPASCCSPPTPSAAPRAASR